MKALLFLSFAFASSLEVPFYPQERNLCAQSSISSLLDYLKLPYFKEELNALYREDIGATSLTDVVLFLRKKGLKVRLKNSNFEELKKSIDSKMPVIVLYSQTPLSRPHFGIVVGYNSDSIILHDGKTPYKELSLSAFDKMWLRTERIAILIDP